MNIERMIKRVITQRYAEKSQRYAKEDREIGKKSYYAEESQSCAKEDRENEAYI